MVDSTEKYLTLKLNEQESLCLELGKQAVGIRRNSDYLRYLITTNAKRELNNDERV